MAWAPQITDSADNPRKLMAKNRQSPTHKSVHFHLKIILGLLLTIFPIYEYSCSLHYMSKKSWNVA